MFGDTGASARHVCLWIVTGLVAAMVGFGLVRWLAPPGHGPSSGQAGTLSKASTGRALLSPDGSMGAPVRSAGAPPWAQPARMRAPVKTLTTDEEDEEDVPPPDPASRPPQYYPRDPDEWQGMLVDLGMQATCGAVDGCGLAMSCKSGRCGPCVQDADCASGEVCVLDHCVLQDKVQCRRRAECGQDQFCILTGYSADARGNADMQAVCLSDSGGQETESEEVAPAEGLPPAEPAPYEPQDLLDEVRGYMQGK